MTICWHLFSEPRRHCRSPRPCAGYRTIPCWCGTAQNPDMFFEAREASIFTMTSYRALFRRLWTDSPIRPAAITTCLTTMGIPKLSGSSY